MVIKFKAWDKINKALSRPFTLQDRFVNYGAGKGVYFFCADYVIRDVLRFELIHFTGAADSNKKEIYENDIVQYECEDGEVYRAKVKFEEYGEEGSNFISGFVTDMATCKCVTELFEERIANYESIDFEVIGNIFESPELLENTKSLKDAK